MGGDKCVRVIVLCWRWGSCCVVEPGLRLSFAEILEYWTGYSAFSHVRYACGCIFWTRTLISVRNVKGLDLCARYTHILCYCLVSFT